MKKILILLLVISVQTFGQNKKYAERLNADLTIDSFYHKQGTDSVFAYSNDAFVSFTRDYYLLRDGLEMPNNFGNFQMTAHGYYRDFSLKSQAVHWDGINSKPSTFPATASTVGSNLLTLANPASASLINVNTNGTTGTRNLSELRNDLSINNVDNTSDANKPLSTAAINALALKAPINNAAFTGTFDAPNGTITNADLAGSIDLATKVTGVLPFLNGGSSGSTAAAPATTGAMTVNMTSRMITITPTGACTFNASGGVAGQMITFLITTSGTSSFVMTWGTNFRKVGTLATGTTSARFFAVSFICIDGTIWQEISRTAAQT